MKKSQKSKIIVMITIIMSYYSMDFFFVSEDYKEKRKEIEKADQYWHLACELTKLKHVRVTVIPVVVGALGMVTKEKMEEIEIRWRIDSIQTVALLRAARIFRRVRVPRRHVVTQTPGKNHQIKLVKKKKLVTCRRSYLPTPPLGQDMTQGQILSGV